jgi:hypothetical protein
VKTKLRKQFDHLVSEGIENVNNRMRPFEMIVDEIYCYIRNTDPDLLNRLVGEFVQDEVRREIRREIKREIRQHENRQQMKALSVTDNGGGSQQ